MPVLLHGQKEKETKAHSNPAPNNSKTFTTPQKLKSTHHQFFKSNKTERAHYAYGVNGCTIVPQGLHSFLKSNSLCPFDRQNLRLYPSKYQQKQREKLLCFFFFSDFFSIWALRQPHITLVCLKSEKLCLKIFQQSNHVAACWTAMFERGEKKGEDPTLPITSVHWGRLHRIVTIS